MGKRVVPVYFHEQQLEFKPRYEWALGEKIAHPETTARAESILAAVQRADRFDVREPDELPAALLREQHHHALLTLYDTAASTLAEDQTFHPMVFPKHSQGRRDPTNLHQSGGFCFDSGTPLTGLTRAAAVWSASCAWRAATDLLDQRIPLVYALSRPPGHHATHDLFGGYCYLNNNAFAARVLRSAGRVALLDIDFHHGNGSQSIFWEDPRVFTVSIHGDPRHNFPYFSGYPGEAGAGAGAGSNLNVLMENGTDLPEYRRLLEERALAAIRNFAPDFLVLAAGFDTYHKDPVGHAALRTDDYHVIGELIGRLGLPTVVVQEGGYYTAHLGRNTVTLLDGLRAGLERAARSTPQAANGLKA